MLITIFTHVSGWRTCVRGAKTAASILASVPLIVIFICMMVSFIITLSKDRIKLETRADKLKEVERRSLRIVQVRENNDEDDNL